MKTPNDSGTLSYDVHTNRELEFMLERGKPLAHFYDAYPSEPDEEIFPEEAFAPYVENGKFVMREFVESLREPPKGHPNVRGVRHLFYARAGEGWRIDAYIMMMAAAAKGGWSEGFERLQGSLLGYEECELPASVRDESVFWLIGFLPRSVSVMGGRYGQTEGRCRGTAAGVIAAG